MNTTTDDTEREPGMTLPLVVDHLGVVPLFRGDEGWPSSVTAWFLYWLRAVQGEEGAPGVEHRRPAKRTRRAVEEGNGRSSRPLTARSQYSTASNALMAEHNLGAGPRWGLSRQVDPDLNNEVKEVERRSV